MGYRSLFDRAHRDVTNDTRRRCQKKSISSRTSPSSSKSASPARSVELLPYSARTTPEYCTELLFTVRSIPFGISQDYETKACDWFLAVFGEHPSTSRANADFLLHLRPMVQRTAMSSPLHKALSAVAVSFAGVITRDFVHAEKAYASYASATNLLRKSIDDPRRSLDDDVLMTIIMLSFYDSVNGHFNLVQDSHESHLLGALALIDHRKSTNYKNEASKAMLDHVQNGLLQHALLCRKSLPNTSAGWFKDSRMPTSYFRQLNDICRDLTDLLVEAEHIPECLEDTLAMPYIIRNLAEIDKRLVEWQVELPASCSPVSMRATDIPTAVRQTGVYRESCYVYKNLRTATMLNLWRTRRLMLLHRLQICVDISDCYGCALRPDGYERIPSTMQSLVDEVCETAPFLLGDISRHKPAILVPEVCFPHTTVDGTPYPESYSNHVRHATTSGAWTMMEPLILICGLSDKHNGKYAMKLRNGQVEWVKSQLKRLQ